MFNDWSGGLNIRVHGSLIAPNESVEYQNCDNEEAILKPIKKAVPTEYKTVGRHFKFFEAGDKLFSSNLDTYWVEYREHLYVLEPENAYKIDKNLKQNNLGIKAPTRPPSVSETNGEPLSIKVITLEDTQDEVINALGIEIAIPKSIKGTYKYVYTYYNNLDGTESRPSRLSNELDIREENIVVSVSGIQPSLDPQVTHIRVYRIGGSLTKFSLIKELRNAPDSSDFVDNMTDWAVAGNYVLDSFNNYEPLTGMKHLTEAYAMLFASKDDKLYYTDIAKPNSWPRSNYIDFEDTITGIGATQHGLLVFTKYKTYIITGNSPLTFSKYLLSGEHGCINHRTVGFVENTLIWVGTDGICTSNGGLVELISQIKLGKVSLVTRNAIVHDKMYVIALANCMLIFDFRYNKCFRTANYAGDVGVFYDSIFYNNNGVLYKMFSDDAYEIMTYQSGIISFGSLSTYKTSKDVYISYSGDLHIKIWIHTETTKKVIADKQLPEDRTQFNLKTVDDLAGYAISYMVTGNGKLYEIDFRGTSRDAD